MSPKILLGRRRTVRVDARGKEYVVISVRTLQYYSKMLDIGKRLGAIGERLMR
jgi:hypothetical protein